MSTPTEKRTKPDPSETARILETVELLLALHEERSDQGEQVQPLSEEVSSRLTSLEEKLTRLTEWSESSVSQADPGFSDSGNDFIAGVEDRFADSLANMEKTLAEQLGELGGRFDQLEKVAQDVQSQLRKMETDAVFNGTNLEGAGGFDQQAFADAWSESAKGLQQHFEEQLERFANQISGNTQSGESQAVAEELLNPSVAPSEDEDSASHWEQQKRAMLQKYGIDLDHRPLEEDKAKAKPKPAASESELPKDSAVEKLEELQQSIQISPEDSEAIEKLKKDLNSKLRDAEVELSINRAKLSQEKAELEQQRVELEQRAADLEAKLASRDANYDKKSSSIMSRFSRHLGR